MACNSGSYIFLYLKMRHRPWDEDSHKACKPDDSFQWYNFFFFHFLFIWCQKYAPRPIIFPAVVCKSSKLKGFIFLTHHSKTMSCRTVASNWECEGGHTQPSSGLRLKQSQVTGVRAVAPVCINSHCLVKKAGLLYVSVTAPACFDQLGFLQYSAWDTCRQQQDEAASPSPVNTSTVSVFAWLRSYKMLLQNSFLEPFARRLGLMVYSLPDRPSGSR